jgi:molybdenum cofactor cytidylyltransferase
MPTPAIILAAGASRRLGQPKQLVLIDGESLLARTIRVVREAGSDPVFVVLGGNRELIEPTLNFGEVVPVLNEDWEQGIASSIGKGVQALRKLSPNAKGGLILASDQPLLTADHLKLLIASYRMADYENIVASKYGAAIGIPAVFPVRYFEELLTLRGDLGAKRILTTHSDQVSFVSFVGGELDIDTPEDLKKLTSRLSDQALG